jgi:hypothetical protein
MDSHLQLSDDDLKDQFENCSLKPELFTHEAHLRLGWIYITKYGLEKAEEKLKTYIPQFDKAFGDGTKFNLTLTMASAKVLYHFIQKKDLNSFTDFIREFPRLKTNFKDVLYYHYSNAIFGNEKAKHTYIEPDLLPFDQ